MESSYEIHLVIFKKYLKKAFGIDEKICSLYFFTNLLQ